MVDGVLVPHTFGTTMYLRISPFTTTTTSFEMQSRRLIRYQLQSPTTNCGHVRDVMMAVPTNGSGIRTIDTNGTRFRYFTTRIATVLNSNNRHLSRRTSSMHSYYYYTSSNYHHPCRCRPLEINPSATTMTQPPQHRWSSNNIHTSNDGVTVNEEIKMTTTASTTATTPTTTATKLPTK